MPTSTRSHLVTARPCSLLVSIVGIGLSIATAAGVASIVGLPAPGVRVDRVSADACVAVYGPGPCHPHGATRFRTSDAVALWPPSDRHYNTSFGAFQLHYGGSGIPGMNAMGLGDDFTKQTGMNARDPRTWRAQVDFALRRAAKAGWTDWHGAKNTGISKWQGIGTYKGPVPGAAQTLPAPSLGGPIGDRAALDAEQRARTGRAQPGDAGLLGAYRQQQNTPPASGVPVKVDVVSQPLDPARQKLADAMNADLAKRHELAQHIVDLHKAGKLTPDYLMHMGGKHMVLGSSSINANRTHNERHGDTFHVHAKTAQEGMDAAVKVSARRGEQDKIRFGQGSQS